MASDDSKGYVVVIHRGVRIPTTIQRLGHEGFWTSVSSKSVSFFHLFFFYVPTLSFVFLDFIGKIVSEPALVDTIHFSTSRPVSL